MNILFISNLYNTINYTGITDLLKIMFMCRRTVLSRSAIMDDCDEKVESIQRIPSISMRYIYTIIFKRRICIYFATTLAIGGRKY
jgi:hypothetical protein